jgi:hypothetical protein
MSSCARLVVAARFLQRPTLYKTRSSLLWNVRAGPSTSSGILPYQPSPLFRTFSLSVTRLSDVKPPPRKQEEKDDDEEAPKQMEHQVPQPVFSLPGGLTFPFARSALADAALTTIIGLVMGVCSPVGQAEGAPSRGFSICWRCCVSRLV